MKPFGVCGSAFMLGITMLAGPIEAQRVAATDQRSWANDGRVQEMLNRRITVDFDRVPLRRIVDALAANAGVRVVYRVWALNTGKLVAFHAADITLGAALERALAGTDLRAVPLGDNLISIESGGRSALLAEGNIRGTVTDGHTKRPLSGVAIAVDGTVRAHAADDGTYRVGRISSGVHTVTVRRIGYARIARTVTISDGADAVLDVVLEPSMNTLDQVVVTGTIIPTELKAVPNAITVITAKQIEERGITRIDQLFRGDVPGVFAMNYGSYAALDEVTMFSRGATTIPGANSAGTDKGTNPIKTYIDGVEMADAQYLSQIDPRTIARIEILTGPQASTIYGSNALNGVMQIFTKRGTGGRPQINANVESSMAQNNLSSALAPSHTLNIRASGLEGRWSYFAGGSVDYMGAWTPAKRTTRYDVSGGGRTETGKVAVDMSARRGITQNRQGGDRAQVFAQWSEEGLRQPNGQEGIGDTRFITTLYGQTVGITLGYRPTTWWSHEFVTGTDASNSEYVNPSALYKNPDDSLLGYSEYNNSRTSERYSTTAVLSTASVARATVTFGADHWRSQYFVASASGTALTGALGNPTVYREKPGKNTGGFLQGQLAVYDALFLTYGVRAEWNPGFGNKARVLPGRYGAAYTREIGSLTAKFRGSYGRSTRPPAADLKMATPPSTVPRVIANYGSQFINQLANPDLGPEFQQGGEGGIELYWGNHGSLVVTRYNQTVDALIKSIFPVDSVRSITPTPTLCSSTFRDPDGYCYRYQSQYINAGSIRNQGWELQGSVSTGPLTTQATYSWTKSRVIGITQKYRALFASDPYFRVGQSFDYIPEHTWATTIAYAKAATSLSVTVNGTSQLYKQSDDLTLNVTRPWRDPNYRLRVGLPDGYRSIGRGYALAHFNGARRFSSVIDGILQVQNLTNYYRNDFNTQYPVMGRLTKIGLRLRVN